MLCTRKDIDTMGIHWRNTHHSTLAHQRRDRNWADLLGGPWASRKVREGILSKRNMGKYVLVWDTAGVEWKMTLERFLESILWRKNPRQGHQAASETAGQALALPALIHWKGSPAPHLDYGEEPTLRCESLNCLVFIQNYTDHSCWG